MKTFNKRSNAQRSAERMTARTNHLHKIEACDGGYRVVPLATEAAAVAEAPSTITPAVALPTPPDFSANTHKPHRAKLAKLVELAIAGDIAGLAAVEIKPYSSSPKAMLRYRDAALASLAGNAQPSAPARAKRRPKVHPADARDLALIPAATSFVVFHARGRGANQKETHTTVEAALEAARDDARAVVYAITAKKQNVMVPADYTAPV